MFYQFKIVFLVIGVGFPTATAILSDCSILTSSDLGSNITFSSEGLLAESLFKFQNSTQHLMYWVMDFNIICLSQGTSKEKYTSSSVVVAYLVKNGDIHVSSQRIGLFHFRCYNLNWKLNLITTIDTTIASSSLMDIMNKKVKKRCWMCTELIKNVLNKKSDDYCLGM